MACVQQLRKPLTFAKLFQRRSFAAAVEAIQNDVTLHHLTDEKHEGVSVLSLNRAKQKNALSKHLITCFGDAVTDVAKHEPRVLLIRSSVPGAFCAGADLKERKGMAEKDVYQYATTLRGLLTRISILPFPVIAAIDGFALGGGLELALACDIRVASSVAKMGLVETKLAIIPGAGGTARLPRIIGIALAKELIMTARVLDGKEAKKIGLVNHAVEQNETFDAAYQKSLEIAAEILPNGPIAVKMAKFALSKGFEVDIETALAFENVCYSQVLPTKDRLEALKAFSEKRPPKFIGA